MASKPRYQYSPLEKAQIRVLYLHVQTNNLQCHIRTIDLPENPSTGDYIALSYAWGHPEQPFSLKVVDETDDNFVLGYIQLTTNLQHALTDLKNANDIELKTFWIDQICINQEDVSERGSQVNMMARIYTVASSVVTYLGLGEDTDDEAIDLLLEIHQHFEPFYDKITPGKSSLDVRHEIPAFPTSENGSEVMKRLLNIVLGSWTHRLWMTQETVLNTTQRMLRGARELLCQPVMMIPALLANGVIVDPPGIDRYERVYAAPIEWMRNQRHIQGQKLEGRDDLWWLLSTFRYFNVTDPRDRIYSLLSLARDAKDLDIHVDYTADVVDVLTHAMAKMLQKSPQLGPLHFAGIYSAELPGLPSWVPTWGILSKASRGKRLCGVPAGFRTPSVRFEQNERVLVTPGVKVGQLKKFLGSVDFDNLSSFEVMDGVPTTFSSGEYEEMLKVLYEVRCLMPTIDQFIKTLACTLTAKFTLGRDDNDTEDHRAKSLLAILYFLQEFFQKSDDTMTLGINISIFESPREAVYLAEQFSSKFAGRGRGLWISDEHLLLCPLGCEEGDVYAIFIGGDSVYVLRPTDNGNFTLVGTAYNFNLMHGNINYETGWEERITDLRIV
jgi:Heterokaryon incompatibility protein (HET)